MNFVEAMELLRAVTALHIQDSRGQPSFRISYSHGEGYVLAIKVRSINSEGLSRLKNVVETRHLGTREFKGYLIIYSRWNV
jgi:hypothetical protein